MQKALLILLTLGLALALAVGCGGSAPAPSSTPAPAATTAPPATTAPTPAVSATAAVVPTRALATPTTAPATPTSAVPGAGSSDLLGKMKGLQGQGFSADMLAEAPGGKMEGKFAFSATKTGMDVTAQGMSVVMYLDQEKQAAYMYNAAENTALVMPYDQAKGQSGDVENIFDWGKNQAAPPKYLGDETIDGRACAVYEFTTTDAKSKSWIDKETGFPIKSITTLGGETATVMFKNVKIGLPDESELTLPADAKIVDMSGLMSGTPVSGSMSINAQASGTASLGAEGVLNSSTIVGPVPAELKESIPVPEGFTLVSDSGQRMEDGDTGVFKAQAAWTGDATMQEIADFYTAVLSEDWNDNGGVVDGDTVDISFDKKGAEPPIRLVVQAEPMGGGIVTLGDEDYNSWLRQALEIKQPAGSIVFVLTVTNDVS